MNVKIFLSLFSLATAHQFKLCDKNIMGIKNVNLTPDPPVINSDLSVELEGSTDKAILSLKFYLKYLS